MLTFAACFALGREPQDGQWLMMIRTGVMVTLAAIFLAQAAPAILRPSYSIRNASLALQTKISARIGSAYVRRGVAVFLVTR
jgi:hypothetical protein